MSYDMFRSAVGEFLGTLLFLFSGEHGDRTNDQTKQETNEPFWLMFRVQINCTNVEIGIYPGILVRCT